MTNCMCCIHDVHEASHSHRQWTTQPLQLGRISRSTCSYDVLSKTAGMFDALYIAHACMHPAQHRRCVVDLYMLPEGLIQKEDPKDALLGRAW